MEVIQCAITQSDLQRGRNDNQAPNSNLSLVRQMRHMQDSINVMVHVL